MNPQPSPRPSNGLQSIPAATPPQGPKLLDRLRQALAEHHYAPESIERTVDWNRRFILCHDLRHPESMGPTEVEQFLRHLAV